MDIIVLTGGTLGGKTTIIENIKRKYSYRVVIIPEVASLLFEEVFKRPKVWTLEWHYSLQRGILKKQYELEEEAKRFARKNNIKVIVCDRGMLDPSAYLENGKQELIHRFGFNEEELLKRYTLVFHLVSLSVINPGLYEKNILSNPFRIENVDEARKQELGSFKAWENHPNRIIFSESLEKSEEAIFKIIDFLLC